jgi:hypothetical protein
MALATINARMASKKHDQCLFCELHVQRGVGSPRCGRAAAVVTPQGGAAGQAGAAGALHGPRRHLRGSGELRGRSGGSYFVCGPGLLRQWSRGGASAWAARLIRAGQRQRVYYSFTKKNRAPKKDNMDQVGPLCLELNPKWALEPPLGALARRCFQ